MLGIEQNIHTVYKLTSFSMHKKLLVNCEKKGLMKSVVIIHLTVMVNNCQVMDNLTLTPTLTLLWP